MTAAALREALLLWVRRPREMALANLMAFAAIFLPAAAFTGVSGALVGPAAVVLGLWTWLVFNLLCAACVLLEGSAEDVGAWGGLGAWLREAWIERLSAFAVGAGLALWLGLAFSFYRSAPLPAWLSFCLMGLLGAFGFWALLALLLSMGAAANSGQPWRALWKASALLPVAYAPESLTALALFLCALGLPVWGMDFRKWSVGLGLVPMMLCPLFTMAFLAAYLTALVQAMLRMALGRPALHPPSWRELWTLWR